MKTGYGDDEGARNDVRDCFLDTSLERDSWDQSAAAEVHNIQ